MSKSLTDLGFAGDLLWVYNEEGSGAKFYKSSAYFPDSRTNPRSQSGITIDPGLDLGHADITVINRVLSFYETQGFLTSPQKSLLLSAVGKKKFEAINWISRHEASFKRKFLVPELVAIQVMNNFTAPPYWSPLTLAIPELLNIQSKHLKTAVHTSLLSHSYNRGAGRAVSLAKNYIINDDYSGLANAIKNVNHPMESLNKRRKKEGDLILDSLKLKEKFSPIIEDVNPLPVTAIPFPERDPLIIKEVQI